MKRTGWETWLAPINYNLYFSFPSSAVEGLLPKARFGDFDMYVSKDTLLVLKSVSFQLVGCRQTKKLYKPIDYCKNPPELHFPELTETGFLHR